MPPARELVVLPPQVTIWPVVGFLSMVLGVVQPERMASAASKIENVLMFCRLGSRFGQSTDILWGVKLIARQEAALAA